MHKQALLLLALLFCGISPLKAQFNEYLASAEMAVVKPAVLNLRANPSSDANIIKKLRQGQKITLIERSDKWAKVKIDDLSGWVASFYIEEIEVIEESAPLSGEVSLEPAISTKTLISKGSIEQWMEASEVLEILGEPETKARHTTKLDRKETWEYTLDKNSTLYLSFQNSVLISYQISKAELL